MSNYFYLELDTTAPPLEIIAPSYTVRGITTEILIESNEPLMDWQDIKIIDGAGVEHKVIFKFDGDKFIGQLNFVGMNIGICTIQVVLRDEVGNTTDTAVKSINVLPKQNIVIEYREKIREKNIYEWEFTHIIAEKGRDVIISEYTNKLDAVERVRPHILRVEKQDGVM